jgi:lysozyme family protein
VTFEQAVEFVLAHEGGHSDDQADKGGETAYGISHRSYPDLDLKTLTKEQAKELYKFDFWLPLHCDELPQGVDLMVFDAAANQGKAAAARMLQKSVGAVVDGVVGPDTIKAAQLYPSKTIIAMAAERMFAYGAHEQFIRYGAGWARRLMAAVYLALERK